MLPLPDNFRYMNRENRWLDFQWSGLSLTGDGALELLPSPKLVSTTEDLAGVPAPTAPAGLAVDAAGRVFYTVPEQNKIFAVGGCSAEQTELRCLIASAGLSPLNAPRGLLVLENPGRLLVVDSGNHRILVFDLQSFALRDLWGQQDPAANPTPGSSPGQFNTPWTVSPDGDGCLYVLDYGNQRVQKFRPTGDPDEQFTARMQQSKLVGHPGALAVAGKGDQVEVFVYDIDAQAIYVFDGSGAPVLDAEEDALAIRHDGMTQVLALAVGVNALYAGDNHLRRVLAFHRSPGFPFAGEAAGFEGPVAALAVSARYGLFLNTGSGLAPLQMSESGAYLSSGVLWSSAISSGSLPAVWNRLRTEIEDAAGSHIEFHYSLSNSSTAPPVYPATQTPFSDSRWTALPRDIEHFLLDGTKSRFLFVGAIFRGDGSSTIRLRQMRADFNDPGYLRYLPAIYRESIARVQSGNRPALPAPDQTKDADFVRRLLALFQSIFDDVEAEMESLPRYFNPQSTPPEALPWLASWLAVDIDRGEPLARIRSGIARAFHRYQWRGTVEGLKLALLEEAGVHANITQPVANASFLAFAGDTSCSGSPSGNAGVQLGSNTHLAAMEPGGAVLGSTAQLDHSYLITSDLFGEPLFEETAHQFIVEVYASEVDSEARIELVRKIVEREKPAHTLWRLSLLEPSMRAGFQSRAGIDSIVAGTPGASQLGIAGTSEGLRLGGGPPLRVGSARLGQDLKLQ
ncbi:MAG TPA: phage tail protein [Candidatus Angelobacter sp.]|jgi:phage tail-like protein|nr:phage tail protein [Candidatus Angelobacter sp.]